MKNIKKSLATLSLASTLLFNTVGCSSSQTNNASNSSNVSASESVNVYNTADYYLVYLNGNYYLTTRKFVDWNYNNDKRERPHYEYYDLKSVECVGSVLGTYYTGDVYKDDDKKWKYDVVYADYMDFEGKYGYGYGKIIPEISVIPVSEIVSNKGLSQSELEFFSSNSSELKEMIEGLIVYNSISVKDYVNMKPDLIFRSWLLYYGDSAYSEVGLSKFVCQKSEGKVDVFLGYRCSYYDTDMGYNYVYDILTGDIIYIGIADTSSYTVVNEYSYDNSGNLTLKELSDRFANLDEIGKESDSSQKMKAEDIVVLDTSRIEIKSEWDWNYLDGDFERFYFLCNTQERLEEANSWIFKDLFNDADAYVGDSLGNFNYSDYNKNVVLAVAQEISPIISINDYLRSIGRDDLVKDEYTLEEISEVRSTILGLDKTRKLEIND